MLSVSVMPVLLLLAMINDHSGTSDLSYFLLELDMVIDSSFTNP